MYLAEIRHIQYSHVHKILHVHCACVIEHSFVEIMHMVQNDKKNHGFFHLHLFLVMISTNHFGTRTLLLFYQTDLLTKEIGSRELDVLCSIAHQDSLVGVFFNENDVKIL